MGYFGYSAFKNIGSNQVAANILIKLQDREKIAVDERNLVKEYLLQNESLLRSTISNFLDDADLVEKVSKKQPSAFSEATRLIHQKKYQQAYDLCKKIQPGISSKQLQFINLMRLVALEKQLQKTSQETIFVYNEFKEQNPDVALQILAFYQVGDIGFEEVFLKND